MISLEPAGFRLGIKQDVDGRLSVYPNWIAIGHSYDSQQRVNTKANTHILTYTNTTLKSSLHYIELPIFLLCAPQSGSVELASRLVERITLFMPDEVR